MNRHDLAALLADQTPACGPARQALLSDGAFTIANGLIPAKQHAGVYSLRHRRLLRRNHPALGVAESVAILRQAGDEPVRIALVDAPDRTWAFVLFLDATATRVLACAAVACLRPTAAS